MTIAMSSEEVVDPASRCGFAALLETSDPAVAPVCLALRETLLSLHAAAVEHVRPLQRTASYGIGPRQRSQHYAFISPRDGLVRLGFYRGAFLHDPDRLMIGTGPRRRLVPVVDAESARSASLAHLIRQAISERLASRG